MDRDTSSTLLEDRRDACRALKALSREYRIEVGAQGMPALIQVLLQMDNFKKQARNPTMHEINYRN